MMETFGFIYDNTMSVSGGPYWPQTLAYHTAWKCSSIYCPKNAHPGVWEVPINRFIVPGSQQEFTMLKEAIRVCPHIYFFLTFLLIQTVNEVANLFN